MNEASHNAYDPENLDVLLRLRAGGDTLTQPRNVHFSVVFAEEEAALGFTKQVQQLGSQASFECNERFEPVMWDATVIVSLIASEESIGEFELLLERLAVPLGGRNDGWYCERIVDDPNRNQSEKVRA